VSSVKHILVVEDERHLAMGIKFNLEAEGYRVTTAADGPAALKLIEENEADIDLVVLDIMLPGMSGYTVCETLRDRGSDVPVLILSARTLSEDRTRGFDVGANQYLSKPFDLDELLSRVRNLLTHHVRRHQASRLAAAGSPTTYEFGTAKLNFPQFEAIVAGQPVQLTKREWELLEYFVENEGRLIPRQESHRGLLLQTANLRNRRRRCRRPSSRTPCWSTSSRRTFSFSSWKISFASTRRCTSPSGSEATNSSST